MTKLVILAGGRGTRIRQEAPGVRLEEAQRRMAERGLKGLIPFRGHAYLDYVISAAADAGLREVCLVVGPGTSAIRRHYERLETRRVRIGFAVQEEPLGSAHALLAAERFAGGDPALVINADNYYPASVLARLRQLEGSGMVGFRRDALVSRGNISRARLAAYALVNVDADGFLATIVEKPAEEQVRRVKRHSCISMTCWRFGPSIFDACRSIVPSLRGEYELTDAVTYLVQTVGERFRVIRVDEAVLDLSFREDVASVAQLLRTRQVRL